MKHGISSLKLTQLSDEPSSLNSPRFGENIGPVSALLQAGREVCTVTDLLRSAAGRLEFAPATSAERVR
jgi:hypothetical protein